MNLIQKLEALDPAGGDIFRQVAGFFEVMEWGEDEIKRATRRHRRYRDELYHSFLLIKPRDIGVAMNTEFVYRSHAVELLERVVSRVDTRPPTAAEMCVALSEVSQRAPIHDSAAGLYFRLWARAFPNHPVTAEQAVDLKHYESLFADRMDELEVDLNRKLRDTDRVLEAECSGMHHGKNVNCKFMNVED